MNFLNQQFFILDDWSISPAWVIQALLIIVVTLVLAKVLVAYLHRFLKKTTDGAVGGTILVNIIRAFVYVGGLCVLLRVSFNFDPAVLLGALGVGGIALSLGLQNTVSNLLGGLQISLSHQVRIGDWVEISSFAGEVKDITWRYTLVEDNHGCNTFIPNSQLNSTALKRMTVYQRVKVPLVIELGAVNIQELQAELIKRVFQSFSEHGFSDETCPKPTCNVLGTEEAGISLVLVCNALRKFSEGQVSTAAMKAVLPYLEELQGKKCA